MSLVSIAAIYFVLWWVVLFAVLPFGVKNAHDVNAVVEQGHDAGAPVHSQLLWKFVATTLISAILFGAAVFLIQTGAFGLDDVPFLNSAPKIE
jgi:predicted secreted protein